jgi:hypothetical protein
VLIDVVAVINAAQVSIGKRPLARVEIIALIDEGGAVILVTNVPPENGLASVSITGPFIENKDAGLW